MRELDHTVPTTGCLVILINRNNKKAFLTDGKSCDHWYRIVQRNRADLESIFYTVVVMGVLNPALSLYFNPLKPELNPICYLLALLGAHHFLHVSRIRVKLLTLRLLMSYIYGAPILDVSRSHTTTQHSR